MTNKGQFEEMNLSADCAVWEAMCPEAVDGTLTPAEQRAFDKHVAGCVHCQQELADAQRGAAWLTMLKGNAPEPPANLMAKILAETTGMQPAQAAEFAPVEDNIWTRPRQPVEQPGFFARIRVRITDTFHVDSASAGFQPRFAMTAAMAFFSIALSLNLMGVRLSDIQHASLRPSSISRTVADLSASASRTFQNNRVVYQFESRVSELRKDDAPLGDRDFTPAPQPQQQSQPEAPKQQPTRPHGTSELILPLPAGTRAHGIVRKEV